MTCCNSPKPSGKEFRWNGSKSEEAILNPSHSTATSRCSPKFSKSICFPEADIKLSLTGNWRWAVQFQRHGMQLVSKIKQELLFFREQTVTLFCGRSYKNFFLILTKVCSGCWQGKVQTIP